MVTRDSVGWYYLLVDLFGKAESNTFKEAEQARRAIAAQRKLPKRQQNILDNLYPRELSGISVDKARESMDMRRQNLTFQELKVLNILRRELGLGRFV